MIYFGSRMNITTNQDFCTNQHGCPFTVEGEAKTFNDKDKSREFRNTRAELQKVLKGILYPEEKELSKYHH